MSHIAYLSKVLKAHLFSWLTHVSSTEARSFRTRTLRVSECSGVSKRCRSLTICPITDYPRQSHQDGPVVVSGHCPISYYLTATFLQTFWAPCADEDLAYGTPNGGLLVTVSTELISCPSKFLTSVEMIRRLWIILIVG